MINSFSRKKTMAMGSSLSPSVSNIYMEYFEKLALDSAQHKPPCGFSMLMTLLWSGLMGQSGYRIFSAILDLPSSSIWK
jgi:hypothetical protein